MAHGTSGTDSATAVTITTSVQRPTAAKTTRFIGQLPDRSTKHRRVKFPQRGKITYLVNPQNIRITRRQLVLKSKFKVQHSELGEHFSLDELPRARPSNLRDESPLLPSSRYSRTHLEL